MCVNVSDKSNREVALLNSLGREFKPRFGDRVVCRSVSCVDDNDLVNCHVECEQLNIKAVKKCRLRNLKILSADFVGRSQNI